jgi:hypothetical protein
MPILVMVCDLTSKRLSGYARPLPRHSAGEPQFLRETDNIAPRACVARRFWPGAFTDEQLDQRDASASDQRDGEQVCDGSPHRGYVARSGMNARSLVGGTTRTRSAVNRREPGEFDWKVMRPRPARRQGDTST